MQDGSLRLRAGRSRLDSPREYIEEYRDENDDEHSSSKAKKSLLSLWACRHNFTTNVLVAVTVTTCILTIEFIEGYVTMIASSLTILFAVILVCQQKALRRLISLRHQHNEIRRKLYFFRQERERLHRSMDRLDETAADLHYIPHELHRLSKNMDVDRLVVVIKQRKRVQEQMRQKINQKVIQDIMSIVVQSDRDSSWSLKATEVEKLVVRLGHVDEVEFNEKRFREIIGLTPNLGSVMKVVRSLVERDDEYEHGGDPVFRVKIGSQEVFTV